ncbi:MAG: helix-turn-helix transcriptional regulator [Chloroflexota bacterium]|nr:helix-turn-helix transcriptional regulator [Chloroflexota bacterium]
MDHKLGIVIRSKKLGVLIRDARLEAGESMKACGEVLGVGGSIISKYEKGEKSPSLPELEVLAYYLIVPLEHFWGQKIRSEIDLLDNLSDVTQRIQLRRRIIGVRLRQVREEAGLSMTEVAEQIGITVYRLKSYEMGKFPIPLPELEAILAIYDLPVDEFKDNKGPVGKWAAQKQAIEAFLELPLEMQQFVVKPINQPYLQIAQTLNEMSVDKLRTVAEGLLDITL